MTAHQLSRTEIEQRAAGRILPKLRTDGVTPDLIATLHRWGRILDNASNTAKRGNASVAATRNDETDRLPE